MIASIYAPNQEQAVFLEELSGHLGAMVNQDRILGGDFNMVADVMMDRSTPPLRGAQSLRTSKGLGDWIHNWDLNDIWRTQHGTERDYSFYSHLYSLHARLDMIFCTGRLAHTFKSTEY